jgi:YegS/Rv2252/BmrU family lipid kinase
VSTALLVNPASGRGRGGRLLDAARQAFAREAVTDVRLTTAAGDEAVQVQRALDDGVTTLAVLGGDGTWSKAAIAVHRAGAGDTMRLAFLQSGTGNDFVKNLAAPASDLAAMARLAARGGPERRVDLGAIDHGETRTHFLNCAGFGFDVQVLERTLRGGALSGPLVYVAAALTELFTFRGVRAAVHHVGDGVRERFLMVFMNGHHFGGAFHIAPGADVGDGALDAVGVANLSPLARAALFARVLRGTHLTHRQVHAARAPDFALTFDSPPAFEVDGELVHATSNHVRVRCVPAALRVLTGAAPG